MGGLVSAGDVPLLGRFHRPFTVSAPPRLGTVSRAGHADRRGQPGGHRSPHSTVQPARAHLDPSQPTHLQTCPLFISESLKSDTCSFYVCTEDITEP